MERIVRGRPGSRKTAAAFVVIALIAGLLGLSGSGVVSGQEASGCEVEHLGTLTGSADAVLEAKGRWSTHDCDSRFRAGSDAHAYQFRVAVAGRIRIELASADADSYLYLLAEDGTRIADNDDGGDRLDARIERELVAGVYMLEATTVGGRARGPADFRLSVSRVSGCEIVFLGSLEPGVDLTASDSWSLDTCGSRFVVEHPAHSYSFSLAQGGRVLIDLISENGDPVLSLASLESGLISANDDGGGNRNSRIERYLPAGIYFIEATTYLERDYQPLQADFTLTVKYVDEPARQERFHLKIEETHVPDEVVAGDPFTVNYRVGNSGGGDLPADGSTVHVYVVGRRVFERLPPLTAVGGRWQAGVVYHTGDQTASATSVAIDEVTPFEVTFGDPGPKWVFVAVITDDPDGEELGFQGLWQNLMVLSGPTFDTVTVEVDGAAYWVSASADAEGMVTTSVKSLGDPGAEVDEATQAKAVYAAGVRTQLLDGILERPAIAALAEAADPSAAPVPVSVANPSSSSLVEAFGARYASAVGASGLPETVAAGEAINPIAVEDLTLAFAESASGEYASLAASWSALLERVGEGKALTFDEAFAAQSRLAYAETVLGPAATAGRIVAAARAATLGWDDPEVQRMSSDMAICYPGESALRGALEAAGADVDGLMALDAHLRASLPVWGQAADNALCTAAGVDRANSRFLERLGIDGSEELRELLAPEPPPPTEEPTPLPYRLSIIARLGDDGRIEHGAELIAGFQILPDVRYLRADAPVDRWQFSSDVKLGDDLLGRIRARRLSDGRVEMGFEGAGGEGIVPDVRYLPADLPEGLWFRSGEIEVPAAPG